MDHALASAVELCAPSDGRGFFAMSRSFDLRSLSAILALGVLGPAYGCDDGDDADTAAASASSTGASASDDGASDSPSTTASASGTGSSMSTSGGDSDSDSDSDSTTSDGSETDTPGDSASDDSAESGSGSDGDESTGAPVAGPRLHTAALDDAGGTYVFDESYTIGTGPVDIDWNRWAVLNDSDIDRLYFLPEGRSDEIYQYGLNPNSGEYEYGYSSFAVIPIVDTPANADTSMFGMGEDGAQYRLYFLDQAHENVLGFGFDSVAISYVHGLNAPEAAPIMDTPAGADWSGWAVTGSSGPDNRLYVFADENHDSILEHIYDTNAGTYVYGGETIELDLDSLPTTPSDDFAMVHTGTRSRLYMLEAR